MNHLLSRFLLAGAFAACSVCLAAAADALSVVESDAAITISKGEKTVLVYHKAEVPPPAGADPVYRRSGFIHPLCAPSGEPLTGIHPDDHVHHLGLWHAWVNTGHDGRKIDFWNLKTRTGRIRYKETISLIRPAAGAEKASASWGFTVRQEHIAYTGKDREIVVLDEQFTVTAREGAGGYLIDYSTLQKNITAKPLELPAYRYGGPIAYRGPAHWDKTNSKLLTSEGKTRENGHTTRGRWCAFSGPTEKGPATLAILCHPDNHDAPQRMRIWPPDTHNGSVFFNYVPIQETAWKIEPGETATMRYRVLARSGGIDPKAIDAAWKSYSAR